MIRSLVMLLATFVPSLLTAPPPASARSFLLRPDGKGDAPTIQAALDGAQEGDTIRLASGTYRGAGNRDLNFNGKTLSILSVQDDPDSCVLDCESAGRGFAFHTREGDGCRIEGLSVIHGRANMGAAVLCANHTGPIFRRCVFARNHVTEDGGAILAEGSYARFVRCAILDNVADRSGGAARLCCESKTTLENCTVAGNRSPLASAFLCVGEAELNLTRTLVVFNRGDVAVQCGNASTKTCAPHLSLCDLFGNDKGDWSGCLDGLQTQDGNLAVDPGFVNFKKRDLRLRAESPCRLDRGAGTLPGGAPSDTLFIGAFGL